MTIMKKKPISLHDWATKSRRQTGWKPGDPIVLPKGTIRTVDQNGHWVNV